MAPPFGGASFLCIYFASVICYNRLQETKKELYMGQKESIDRDTYRKVKKMNRDELTKFILKYGDELLGEQGKPLISMLLR
jgi:hypothetical protein